MQICLQKWNIWLKIYNYHDTLWILTRKSETAKLFQNKSPGTMVLGLFILNILWIIINCDDSETVPCMIDVGKSPLNENCTVTINFKRQGRYFPVKFVYLIIWRKINKIDKNTLLCWRVPDIYIFFNIYLFSQNIYTL